MAVHIIEKQVIELKMSTEASSQEIMRRVQPLFEDFIAEDLAQCFDQVDTGQMIQIDRLELDLGKIHIDRFDTAIREALRMQLSAYLRKHVKALDVSNTQQGFDTHTHKDEPLIIQGKEHFLVSTWLFFMQNGFLPASFPGTFHALSLQILEILNVASIHPHLKKKIFQFADAQQLSRFIMHASDTLLYHAFFHLKGLPQTYSEQAWISWKTLILRLLKVQMPSGSTQHQILKIFGEFMAAILSDSVVSPFDSEAPESFWKVRLQDFVKNSATELKQDPVKQPVQKLQDVFLKNVGIVILAPYLLPFFQNLKLVTQRQFCSLEDKEKAVKILGYLATGGASCSEDELAFFKILCGHPLGMPIDINIDLPSHFYQEAESLLESILEHWTVMKGSSSDALRETFLSRTGKLMDQEEYWLLKVENKGVDILLDRIPWTFRTVKLPWMSKSLLVEWY